MKHELKIIHNSTISNELSELFEKQKIDGFTTVPIYKSSGKDNGVFRQDIVSGERFLTFIWFKSEDLKNAVQLKEELEERSYFVVLSNLQ